MSEKTASGSDKPGRTYVHTSVIHLLREVRPRLSARLLLDFTNTSSHCSASVTHFKQETNECSRGNSKNATHRDPWDAKASGRATRSRRSEAFRAPAGRLLLWGVRFLLTRNTFGAGERHRSWGCGWSSKAVRCEPIPSNCGEPSLPARGCIITSPPLRSASRCI